MKKILTASCMSLVIVLFTACGGGGGGGSDSTPPTTTDTTAPTFSSFNTVSVNENQTNAIDVNATDETSSVTYSISDGDSASFDINATTGVISFKVAPDYETKQSYSFTATAKDSANNSDTQNIVITILDEDIVHNTTHYESVISPFTGKVWLDRNLGASQVCAALDDATCYGDYYQWGRNYDGHQESTSATTTTLATDINSAGNRFIANSSDWTTADSNGSLRSANWNKTDGTSICPIGYRVATIDELKAETTLASNPVTNSEDAFSNFLKLPSAGFRSYDGSMYVEGSMGILRSSSINSSNHNYIYIGSASVGMFGFNADGFSVRCIADEINFAPTWTASSYVTGLTITDASDAAQTIQDLTAISSDTDGDAITYSIVSVSVPGSMTAWNNSVVINSGVLQVQNLMTNDPDINGNIVVTIRATSTGGSSEVTVSFAFNNVQ